MFKYCALLIAASAINVDRVYLQTSSDPICNSAGCTQYLHPESKDALGPSDINYHVPHFGMDTDIRHSFEDLKIAEGIVGHQWKDFGTADSKAKYANAAKKVTYNFNPELDSKIKDSIKNLADTEAVLGRKYTMGME